MENRTLSGSCPPSKDDLREAEAVLSALVPEEQWKVYLPVLRQARERGLRFAVGGGLAFSVYSNQPRNTKDLDVFILPPDHETFLDLMEAAGFEEYREVPYDRERSYRGVQEGYILDVLWRMLNTPGELDPIWFTGGWDLEIRGLSLRILPPEELIWTKLYILNRERCDWPDILSILYMRGPGLDWGRLLERVGEDAPVLGGLLSLFRWMCPGRAVALPDWIWKRVGLVSAGEQCPELARDRARFFRGEEWFGKKIPEERG